MVDLLPAVPSKGNAHPIAAVSAGERTTMRAKLTSPIRSRRKACAILGANPASTVGTALAISPGMDKLTIRACMTHAPQTIGVDQTLTVASEMMHAHHIRHLPVLSEGTL